MALSPGTRLGPYEIVSALGAGGMGEVYRARDTKLGRDVALKILPAAVADDPDRLMRFEREAKTLASLNHPSIAAIYGIEDSGGQRALVMELVEGRDLSEVIAQGAMAIDDALPIARQVADALEAAHEAGIIHRDLKPANIKVRDDGTVKVLDFGLAKALDPGGDGSGAGSATSATHPTMTSPALTAMGMILGTAAYMSPEQAKGRPVDRRADIWAFGVVLYEMLTGRQLFQAETVSESIAAVLRADIDLAALPASTPASIRRLLARCLDRDPKTRLQHIGEARIALSRTDVGEPQEPVAPRIPWTAVVVTALVTGLVAYGLHASVRPAAPPVDGAVTFDLGLEGVRPYLSPDGRRIAYVTPVDGQLWIRDLDRLEPRAVATVGRLRAQGGPPMFWSPDSRDIGYSSQGSLWRISVDGGTPIEICRLENNMISGGTWGDDGRIVFGSWRGALYEVPANGAAEPNVLLDLAEGIVDYHSPQFLPNGALTYMPHWLDDAHEPALEVLRGGEKTVLDGVLNGYYSAGYLLTRRGPSNDGIWATPFDLDRLQTIGEPVLVVANAGVFSASADGTLSYSTGAAGTPPLVRFVWRDLGSAVEVIPGEAREYGPFALSPDGRTIAASFSDRGQTGIVLLDTIRGTSVPLVAPSDSEKSGLQWSDDGRALYFVEERGFVKTIVMVPSDGSQRPVDIVQGERPSPGPDDRFLVFERDERGSGSLWTLPLEGRRPAGQPVRLRQNAVSARSARVSPDGALVAYAQSGLTGESSDVFLSRLPDGSGQWPVSVGGGGRPSWNAATGSLFFLQGDDVMAVEVEPGAEPTIGEPRRLARFPAREVASFQGAGIQFSRDGQRMLALQPVGEAPPERLVVIRNWPAMLGGDGR
jgi:serine/threonine-protein kinase